MAIGDTSATYAERATPIASSQFIRAAFFVVLIIFVYLAIPLRSGDRILVPSVPVVALAPILFLLAWRNLSKTDEVFLPKIIFVLLLSIALSPGYEFVMRKMMGLAQCTLALAVAVLIVRLMQQLRREVLERALLVLWCLVIVGCVLEILGVTRAASDAFRLWAYGGSFTLYEGDLRDMTMVGWSRPKLFSVEPSHVTKLFIATVNAWLLVHVTWRKAAVAAAATLAMLTIMGSPMLFISGAITGAVLLWNQRSSLRSRVMMIVAAMMIAVGFATFFEASTYSNAASRVTNVGGATRSTPMGTSEQRRMVFPYVTLADTWQHSPAFGVGITGKDVVMDYTSLPVRRAEEALGNNVMGELGTYLGVIGGAWFIFLLARQARHMGVQRLGLLLAFIVMFSQLMGGIETFRYWGFIALLWGALAIADSPPQEPPRATPNLRPNA